MEGQRRGKHIGTTIYPDDALLDIIRNCTHKTQDMEFALKHDMKIDYVRVVRKRLIARAVGLAMQDNIDPAPKPYPDDLWE